MTHLRAVRVWLAVFTVGLVCAPLLICGRHIRAMENA